MINEKNINKLYEGIIRGKELTTKELNGYGFNAKDLTNLINQGFINRIKRGHYSLLAIKDLFDYGQKLIAENDYDKAMDCFKKCCELDSEYFKVCSQLFLKSIRERDYESAFRYYEVLSNTTNPFYQRDNKFYLYLLSIITDIPPKYKEYIRQLKFEDIKIDLHDNKYSILYNYIRVAALTQKFTTALNYLNDLITKKGFLTEEDKIVKTLLYQIVNINKNHQETLLILAKGKQYTEIVDFLEEKQKRHNLNDSNSYILKLAKEIINIQKNKQIPEKRIFQTQSLFEAIDGCNYELALDIHESYNVKKNIDHNESIIYLLLSDMCETMKQISSPANSFVDANPKEQSDTIANSPDNNTIEIKDSEKEFIENKYQLLLKGQGLVLLKHMDSEKRKRIHAIVKEYPDMVSFSIGEGEKKQIVLKYKSLTYENIENIKSLINAGNLAYKKENYNACIQNYLQLLKFGKTRANVCAKLGLAYLKKRKINLAIDYLTVATELSKQADNEYDFTALIECLKGKIKKENRKPYFKMSIEEFENDVQNYYDIENLNEITAYILETGLDVETACQKFDLTDEQINTIRLIYARKYYSQGNYHKGDQFLATVEKSKNKTKFTINLLNKIRRTKRFYIYRQVENDEPLALTLQPKKLK